MKEEEEEAKEVGEEKRGEKEEVGRRNNYVNREKRG